MTANSSRPPCVKSSSVFCQYGSDQLPRGPIKTSRVTFMNVEGHVMLARDKREHSLFSDMLCHSAWPAARDAFQYPDKTLYREI